MVAKKKGSRTGALAAQKLALEQETQLLRFEREKEQLRNEEAVLRERIEEEENKILEAHHVREREIFNAIAERERKAYYEAREKELTELVELRSREVQELRAKVIGLKQAQELLQNEKASAMQRSSMLSNELELAQVHRLEAEAQMEANEAMYNDNRRVLEDRLDAAQIAMSQIRADHVHLRKKYDALNKEVEEAEAKKDEELKNGELLNLHPQSSDAETAVLLKVLHAEVERYKDHAAKLQSDLDYKERDEEKSSLLIGIMNTQLDTVREENKRLHEKSKRHLEELKATQALLEAEKAKSKHLYEELDRSASEAAVQLRQLHLEIAVHKEQVEHLAGNLSALNTQHDTLVAEHKDFVSRATQREQDDFRANVEMRGDVERLKNELVSILKEKQNIQDEAFNYKTLTRSEMDCLKTRLTKYQEVSDRKERTAYETIMVLRADNHKYEREKALMAESHEDEKIRLQEDLSRARCTAVHAEKLLEDLQQRSSSTEKEIYEKLVHMTACHDNKHAELERQRILMREKDEEYTNNTIFLTAEKENLRTRVELLQNEAQKRRREHAQHIDKISGEMAELQRRVNTDLQAQEEATQKESERANSSETHVQRLTRRVRDLEEQIRLTDINHESKEKAMRADSRDARSELSIAKRTIERLEGAMSDQTSYKQLTELNEKLIKEVEGHRKQTANLNSTIASMKMEQDTMGGYKLQKTMSENEQLSRRLQQLERLHRLSTSILRELRMAVEKTGLTSNLRVLLETYDAQTSLLSTTRPMSRTETAAAAESTDEGAATVLPAVHQPSRPMRLMVYTSIEKSYGPRPRVNGRSTPSTTAADADVRQATK